MKIKIPDNYLGERREGSMEKVLQSSTKPQNQGDVAIANCQMQNPRGYIQVPQFNLAIALRETNKNLNMYSTLEALAGEGLKIPSPVQFMRHWLNVKEAAEGSRTLFYADGTPVNNDVSKDLWNYMSSRDRSPWNGQICHTWLNALFISENNKWYIENDLKVVPDARGNKTLQGSREKLPPTTLRTDGWVSLNFNEQGLPITHYSLTCYEQGENIHFYHPRSSSVARFKVGSYGAYLDCNGDPRNSDSDLGVRAVRAKN